LTSANEGLYDAAGQLAAEYTSAAAQASACGSCFLTADKLGSTRMVTDETGMPRECHDFLPFGEEIPRTSGCYAASTSNTLKFTGKERDQETGNDYFGARYLSAAQGRWTIPDWSARGEAVPYANLGDPQTLNLYGYLRNNPLGTRDVDGHGSCKDKPGECRTIRDAVANGQSIDQGIQAAAAQAAGPPPPPPLPAPPIGVLTTDMKSHTTTFTMSYRGKGYYEVQIETRNDVDSKANPGAADPYSTPAIKGVSGRHAGQRAYGPEGAFIDTNDPRGRAIHGGGSRLAHPFAARQGWAPTMGCTRGQNEDVIKLGEAITGFQRQNPGALIPYVREDK